MAKTTTPANQTKDTYDVPEFSASKKLFIPHISPIAGKIKNVV